MLRVEARKASIDFEGILRFKGRICVLRVGDIIELTLQEAHSSTYSIHTSATKMYRNLRQYY